MHRTTGLTSTEARRRFRQDGPNEIVKPRRFVGVKALFGRFRNPLIITLIVAAVISGVLGDKTSATIVIVAIVLSTLLDFVNTYKSERAAETLRAKVRVSAVVLRDNRPIEIPVRDLVVGDVVQLGAGDIIPADGEVLDSEHFYVNESVLSGESFPKPRETGQTLYMGSSTVSGSANMLITATGLNTKFSHIAASVTEKEPLTAFDRELNDFSIFIVRITFALVVFVFLVNALVKHDVLDSLLFSVALAVGLTPELLPMIIALNLTKGSLAMAKRGVIVKRLSAIQNLGSMDVLCTDKTGTLTENRIVLVKYTDGLGNESEDVLTHAYITSLFESGFKSPLDEAIKEFRKLDLSGYHKIDEVPFDFERKRSSVVVNHGKSLSLISKGAPEEILKISNFYGEANHHLTESLRHRIIDEYQELSRQGFRVLAIANKHLTSRQKYDTKDEAAMTFLGFVAFLDPAKNTVAETLRRMAATGIEIKVLTGDNDLVTRKIASDIELNVKGVLIGSEVAKLSDVELAEKVETNTIFARVDPGQKMRIIKLLQANGHVVGYMGDGVNDAPSLKAADTGISVNNAVDIAKDTADLILIHKSLADLIDGVVEGRRTFVNTLKYLKMELSSNFGNMFSVAGASLALPFLPMLAPQILLNNLIYDTSQVSIPLDNVDDEEISRPRSLKISHLKKYMWTFGPLSSLFDFITFGLLYWGFHLSGSQFQTGWFIESIATQTLVIFILRTKRLPFVKSRPSKYLAITILLGVLAACYIAYGQFGHYFKFAPLSSGPTITIAVIIAVYLIVIQWAKSAFYRKIDL